MHVCFVNLSTNKHTHEKQQDRTENIVKTEDISNLSSLDRRLLSSLVLLAVNALIDRLQSSSVLIFPNILYSIGIIQHLFG